MQFQFPSGVQGPVNAPAVPEVVGALPEEAADGAAPAAEEATEGAAAALEGTEIGVATAEVEAAIGVVPEPEPEPPLGAAPAAELAPEPEPEPEPPLGAAPAAELAPEPEPDPDPALGAAPAAELAPEPEPAVAEGADPGAGATPCLRPLGTQSVPLGELSWAPVAMITLAPGFGYCGS